MNEVETMSTWVHVSRHRMIGRWVRLVSTAVAVNDWMREHFDIPNSEDFICCRHKLCCRASEKDLSREFARLGRSSAFSSNILILSCHGLYRMVYLTHIDLQYERTEFVRRYFDWIREMRLKKSKRKGKIYSGWRIRTGCRVLSRISRVKTVSEESYTPYRRNTVWRFPCVWRPRRPDPNYVEFLAS